MTKKENDTNLQHKLTYLCGFGLLGMTISPFLNWINVMGGGISGINGDGKIFLAMSVVCAALLIYGHIQNKLSYLAVTIAQGWSVFAVVWMFALIWKTETVMSSSVLQGNIFAKALVAYVSAGAGLYVGFIASLVVFATLFWFVKFKYNYKLKISIITHAIISILAVLFFVVVGGSSNAETPKDSVVSKIIFSPFKGGLEKEYLVKPTLKLKRNEKDKYEEYIWLDINWDVLEADKPAKAIKGSLVLTDLFDEEKIRIGKTINKPIIIGNTFSEKGVGIKYNQFIDSHKWLKGTKLENMKAKFIPEAVVYENGEVAGDGASGALKSKYLFPTMKNKRFDKIGYEDFVWFDVVWDTSKLTKPTRAVKGTLHIVDVFSEPQLSIRITIDDSLEPNKPYTEKGTGFEYNQFKGSHQWVLGSKEKDVGLVFIPEAIIYKDGTKEEF